MDNEDGEKEACLGTRINRNRTMKSSDHNTLPRFCSQQRPQCSNKMEFKTLVIIKDVFNIFLRD